MCYHNSLKYKLAKLEKLLGVKAEEGTAWEPIYHASGFAFPQWPVLTSTASETLQLAQWGLIPHWVKTEQQAIDIRSKTLNARSETVFEKPAFRESIRHSRCLIPSSGFFEWRTESRSKYPYFIRVQDTEIFCMAGIASQWVNRATGELMGSFSILTTEANPLMAKIHNTKKRMPVILEADHYRTWLDTTLPSTSVHKLCQPFPTNGLHAHTISKRITSRSADTNVPEINAPFSYPELALLD